MWATSGAVEPRLIPKRWCIIAQDNAQLEAFLKWHSYAMVSWNRFLKGQFDRLKKFHSLAWSLAIDPLQLSSRHVNTTLPPLPYHQPRKHFSKIHFVVAVASIVL